MASMDSPHAEHSTTAFNIGKRFRGFLPVVIDIETAGFNPLEHAILEISAVIIAMNQEGLLEIACQESFHISPFQGSKLEQSALDFTGIDPKREASLERDALNSLFKTIRKEMKAYGCTRAILVAHNSSFDQGFLKAAIERNNIKRSPFHPFSSFDTVSLAGLAFGQTVLAKACEAAHIQFDSAAAHSAHYDALKTAELFCLIVNKWQSAFGFEITAMTD